MLIELSYDLIVSTSQIAKIERLPPRAEGRAERVQITFADGRTEVVDRTFDGLRRQLGTIIPAPPGYSVIYYHIEPEDPTFWAESVLAFRYDGQSPRRSGNRGSGQDSDELASLCLELARRPPLRRQHYTASVDSLGCLPIVAPTFILTMGLDVGHCRQTLASCHRFDSAS